MKTGSKLVSVACGAEVMIIRGAEVTLSCGGHAMVDVGAERGTATPALGLDAGTKLGKRYVHTASGLQVLCVKPGAGALSVGGDLLELVQSKQLPSSD